MSFILLLLALAAGTANPFQAGVNSQLNKHFAQPLWASIAVYATGLAALLLAQIFTRKPLPVTTLSAVPWWAWLGGLISIVSTVIGLTIAQRMGSGLFTGATLTASLVTSILLDHFGLIGFRQHPASPARLAGCALMVAGVWIIART